MSYLTDTFPDKYACTTVSLLKAGYGLVYDGTGSAFLTRSLFTGNPLKKYALLDSGAGSGTPPRTINPLYALLIGRYIGPHTRGDLAKLFYTSESVIHCFNAAIRGDYIGNGPSEETFIKHAGYFFGDRIFGLGYNCWPGTLAQYNDTFAWKSFSIRNTPIDQIRIRA